MKAALDWLKARSTTFWIAVVGGALVSLVGGGLLIRACRDDQARIDAAREHGKEQVHKERAQEEREGAAKARADVDAGLQQAAAERALQRAAEAEIEAARKAREEALRNAGEGDVDDIAKRLREGD